MQTYSKRLLAALASALLLAALVGSASANHLSQNEIGYKVTYSPMSFVPSFGSTIRCPLTIEGTFHTRTLAKTAGALMGYVTRAVVGTCESGRSRMNTETLPWHLQYVGFEGTLPNITGISFATVSPVFEIQGEIFGLRVTCRYTIRSQLATNHREIRGAVTEQALGSESTSSQTEGCPSGRLSATGRVTTASGAAIVLTLI